jgi:hypothetical protein
MKKVSEFKGSIRDFGLYLKQNRERIINNERKMVW